MWDFYTIEILITMGILPNIDIVRADIFFWRHKQATLQSKQQQSVSLTIKIIQYKNQLPKKKKRTIKMELFWTIHNVIMDESKIHKKWKTY